MIANRSVSPSGPGERSVLGTPLISCSTSPMTGFLRDGSCRTCEEDGGLHTVCAEMTAEFLEYTRSRGNDLSTPRPEWGFPGLSPGDRWCLCAARWAEAYRDGVAPRVVLGATHERALDIVPAAALAEHAVDEDASS